MPIPLTKPVELSVLTDAIRRRVPAVSGLGIAEGGTQLIIRRFAGQLTPAEVAIIQEEVDAHDAAAIAQARAARETLRTSERAKSPLSLSLVERVRRVEVILGVE